MPVFVDTMTTNRFHIFAGMFCLLSALLIIITLSVVEGDHQPSPEQTRLFMKGEDDGNNLWLDADPDMANSEDSHSDMGLGPGQFQEVYDQDPPLDRDLYFEDQGTLIIHLHMARGDSGAHSADVRFTLEAGDTVLVDEGVTSPDDENWHYEDVITVDMVSSGDSFRFTWSYDYQGNGAYDMYTDATSYIELPITGNIRPTVDITSPDNNTEVSGLVTIRGDASDADGDETLQGVEVSIDGGPWEDASLTGTDWEYDWDTRSLENRQYTIDARAYDGEAYSDISEIFLNVNNVGVNTPPEISIDDPSNNEEVSGTVTIEGEASDEDGDETVEKVEIRIGDKAWMTVTGTMEWEYEWDTTGLDNGDYDIEARAFDGEEYSESDEITVEVNNVLKNNIPEIELTSHEDGDEVSGVVWVKGNATDDDGDDTIDRVEVSVNGEEWENATGTDSWTFTWDTNDLLNDVYELEIRAFDGIDYSEELTISLIVKNVAGNIIPTIQINSPLDNGIVEGDVVITGSADDEDGTIETIEISIDNTSWVLVQGTTYWIFEWDSEAVENGQHVIKVRAYDGEDHSEEFIITLIVENKDDDGDDDEVIPGAGMMIMISSLLAGCMIYQFTHKQ